MKRQKIDIILPNRIGDTILTLPAILCLKQLHQALGPAPPEYRILTHLPMVDLLDSLELFRAGRFDRREKMRSWFSPADKSFFLSTTTANIGYRSRISHGLRMPNKRHIRYSVHLPYLNYPHPEELLPGELTGYLKSTFSMPPYAIRHFGLCLELGFTVDQIKTAFRFDTSHLSFASRFFDWNPGIGSEYLVFCMEAASGRKRHNADRRWKEEYFLDLAEVAYRKHGMTAAFIGIGEEPRLPDKPYMLDFRGKLTLGRTALLLHHSAGYVGNDTGPLHLANLMKKNAIGIYMREVAIMHYGNLFPQLTVQFLRPDSPAEIYPALEALVSKSGDR